MEDPIFQLSYALDTFYFLICGALVMWTAAGFAMLEAGLGCGALSILRVLHGSARMPVPVETESTAQKPLPFCAR